MAKAVETELLEDMILAETLKQGVFGCFEVTIGWQGRERVDYISYDTNGIWRCYEIKISKADFYSKAKKTFVGHFNYFVFPNMELYEQVKEDIPKHIGVYIGSNIVKRSKRQELQVDEQVLKNSMIRSLSRDAEKLYKSKNPKVIESYNRTINQLRQEMWKLRRENTEITNALYRKYGRKWRDEVNL